MLLTIFFKFESVFRYQEEGDLSTRPKCGRSRKTTVEGDERLVEASLDDPKRTAVSLGRLDGDFFLLKLIK